MNDEAKTAEPCPIGKLAGALTRSFSDEQWTLFRAWREECLKCDDEDEKEHRIEGAEAMLATFELLMDIRIGHYKCSDAPCAPAVVTELRFVKKRLLDRNPRTIVENMP